MIASFELRHFNRAMGIARRPPTSDQDQKNRRRWFFCLFFAVALHMSSLLAHAGDGSHLMGVAPVGSAETLLQVVVDTLPLPQPAAPGGGSLEPDPKGKALGAPEQVAELTKKAPAVVRAPVPEKGSTLDSPPISPDSSLQAPESPDFLLAAGDTEVSVRPHAAREFVIQTRNDIEASAPEIGHHQVLPSSYLGSGYGTKGGGGGERKRQRARSGDNKTFAFGGSGGGAFKAEVCAIPEGTQYVRQVKDCKTLFTFFVNAFNVSPRSFTMGFPGVPDLTEWFAIRYHGKFKVLATDDYKFRLLSDDGAILYIDGRQVINNDGHHAAMSVEKTISLDAGEHDLFVSYYQGPRWDIALQLFVQAPNGAEELFGPTI
ncbi:MAG TPA: PA14 domain-containing protein [Polyangiaceae bacterium]|nr:PA14 domain-containing protein [Polyangiaceae bacterium]